MKADGFMLCWSVAAVMWGVSSASIGQDAQLEFVPEQVFAGRSEGKGNLKLLLGKARPFSVQSFGAMQPDGTFRVDQKVHFVGKPVKSRHWVMRRLRTGQYSAELSDAAGPVVARTSGRRLVLRYPLMRVGLVMHQILDLSPDGRTIANYGSIRFLGIEVGTLRETITIKRLRQPAR